MILDMFHFALAVWLYAGAFLLVVIGVIVGKSILETRRENTESFFYRHSLSVITAILILGLTFPISFPLIMVVIMFLFVISIPITIGILIGGGFKKK